MHNKNTNNQFKIEDRRRKVASMLAQSMTETEIAEKRNVDQSIISRDVKALKEMSQQFVFDLAKSDLAYYYKQSIDGIEEAKKEHGGYIIMTTKTIIILQQLKRKSLH
jgi:IS30 family transposase